MRTFLIAAATGFVALAACGTSDSNPSPSPSATTEADAGDAPAPSNTPVCAAAVPMQTEWSADCPVNRPTQPDTFDDALARAGVDRCRLGYTARDWSIYPDDIAKDPYRLPWYDAVHDHAMRVPAFGRTLSKALDDAAESKTPASGALQVAAFGVGSSAAPCVSPFELDSAQPLARAVATLIRDNGGEPDDAALEADAADVPRPLQEALAQVVLAAGEADATWRSATKSLSALDLTELGKVHALHLRSVKGPPRFTKKEVGALLSKGFDLARVAEGAVALSLRIESADLGRFADLKGFDFEQDTPLGRIVFRDGADHVHESGSHVLLMVDAGGRDTYRFAAGAVDGVLTEGGRAHHVGVAIDLAGADSYGYAEKPNALDGVRLPADEGGRLTGTGPIAEDDGPISLSETVRQGAGRLGYGMLFDLGNDDDKYRSLRLSQGYGAAGVGVLFDAGGDDTYEGEAGVQGAAHFGVGVLVDTRGNDVYRSYSQTQGFGSPRSVGLLFDGDGNDRYLADNGDPADGGDPLYWTIQIPGKGNNSFAQGAAFGRRAGDDGVYMSGGLGMLRDRRGNDEYVASVQAQASGYWFGTGILADGEGNDSYDARYYVQSAGAHFAMALFDEGGGNDRYNQAFAPKATSIGVGHDFTVAWHLDWGGNDVYRGPPLSLGSGNANGIGILVNVGGDDTYRVPAEPTLGAATFSAEWYDACKSCRAVATDGIFIDVGGNDTYEVTGSTIARENGAPWSNRRSPPEYAVIEHSAGLDVENGNVSLP